jgi:hypothetical protein
MINTQGRSPADSVVDHMVYVMSDGATGTKHAPSSGLVPTLPGVASSCLKKLSLRGNAPDSPRSHPVTGQWKP